MTVLTESRLPLPLVRKGKVREVYQAGPEHLLLVASDRVSAFDVVMREAIPRKGAVLTQISAFWFGKLAGVVPNHFVTAKTDEIVERLVAETGDRRLATEFRGQLTARSMLVKRTAPVPFECVIRGYLAGSAWKEYQEAGTLAGEPLPKGLVESAKLEPPIFSPATKAETGHDINVTFDTMAGTLGRETAMRLREASFAVYRAGRDHAAGRGIIIADTKFEFGMDPSGTFRLIDEVLTPDSSRFWPLDQYEPGRSQPSFDKQPLRDWLAGLRRDGRWNGEAPPPTLTPEVIAATSARYLEAYKRITGLELEEAA
jgi:phosphoribosylaminoimidazole-succinocarboxamide synthase